MPDVSDTPTSSCFSLDNRPFRFWRDQFCDGLLGADCPPGPSALAGQADVALVSGLISVDMATRVPGLGLVRGPSRIANETREEAVGLTYVLHGTNRVVTGGREHVLRPGDVSLLTSGEPFEKLLSPTYREHFLYLPGSVAKTMLGRSLPEARRTVAPLRGLGALLAETLASLARHRLALRCDDWPPVLGAVFQLVDTVFGAGEAEAEERARPAARMLQRERVLRYIDEHQGDPDLSPTRIAQALGMSIRYLHLLFEDAERSVGETIRARRLERARERLVDPASRDQQVGEIAFACGFNDAAHFSRAFKARFGLRPSDVRPG